MAAEGDQAYSLGHGSSEVERLNVQHRRIIKTLGYTLHPTLLTNLPVTAHIADVGTGTAIFLLSLPASLPEMHRATQLHLTGFDLSASKFPPASAHPANLTLHVSNAKAPPPALYAAKYDVVHIQFLIFAMPNPADWALVAAHAFALLKPGGWLQWTEPDTKPARTILRRGPVSPRTGAAHREMFAAVGEGKIQGGEALEGVVWSAGFEEVDVDTVSSDRWAEDRLEAAVNSVKVYMEVLRVRGEMADVDRQALEERVMEEVKGGVYTRYDIWTVVARKPGPLDK